MPCVLTARVRCATWVCWPPAGECGMADADAACGGGPAGLCCDRAALKRSCVCTRPGHVGQAPRPCGVAGFASRSFPTRIQVLCEPPGSILSTPGGSKQAQTKHALRLAWPLLWPAKDARTPHSDGETVVAGGRRQTAKDKGQSQKNGHCEKFLQFAIRHPPPVISTLLVSLSLLPHLFTSFFPLLPPPTYQFPRGQQLASFLLIALIVTSSSFGFGLLPHLPVLLCAAPPYRGRAPPTASTTCSKPSHFGCAARLTPLQFRSFLSSESTLHAADLTL